MDVADHLRAELNALAGRIARLELLVGMLAGALVRRGVLTEEEARVWKKDAT